MLWTHNSIGRVLSQSVCALKRHLHNISLKTHLSERFFLTSFKTVSLTYWKSLLYSTIFSTSSIWLLLSSILSISEPTSATKSISLKNEFPKSTFLFNITSFKIRILRRLIIQPRLRRLLHHHLHHHLEYICKTFNNNQASTNADGYPRTVHPWTRPSDRTSHGRF